jgi:hypothetical protein
LDNPSIAQWRGERMEGAFGMKTFGPFLIAGLLLLAQSVQAGQRGGGVGFVVPASHAGSSVGHATSAPVIHPAATARSAPNFQRNYSPTVQIPQRILPAARTYNPRSAIAPQQRDAANSAARRNVQNGIPVSNALQAVRRDRHESHDRDWWRRNFNRIVIFGGGYYYWDNDFWYPAWGYDPNYSYDNDGPIYAYGNLMPDQVISNVQIELQQEGYYAGPINGSLDPLTRAAIATYQRDHGLGISGTVDATTVESLGLG